MTVRRAERAPARSEVPLGQCLEPGSQLAPIGVLSRCFLEQMALSQMEQTPPCFESRQELRACRSQNLTLARSGTHLSARTRLQGYLALVLAAWGDHRLRLSRVYGKSQPVHALAMLDHRGWTILRCERRVQDEQQALNYLPSEEAPVRLVLIRLPNHHWSSGIRRER